MKCELCEDRRLTFNDEETEEQWIQCDICKFWVHQICARLAGQKNDAGQARYTCSFCKDKDQIEKCQSSTQSVVHGAKDLPRTFLSNHLEKRLFRVLRTDKEFRETHGKKSDNEVEGAEGLAIRVVLSVDKKLEVKQRFLEIVQEENYPMEFPYKSKVILLFQEIEGVSACLFGMYVQEFGSKCQPPNQRCIYISHLDSTMYLKPNIITAMEESLVLMVYQEILIGYLEYCKKRGFGSCYISAFCPLERQHSILYCLPELQKMPKSNELREWYLSMLKKAHIKKVIFGHTNLYDHFSQSRNECKSKVTGARFPYFDDENWFAVVESVINQMRQEEDDEKQNKEGTTKETEAGTSGQLMKHKKKTIGPMKEDYIVVQLQHACAHCYLLMVSGTCWVCNLCENFYLCDRCHEANGRCERTECHPITDTSKKHSFKAVNITNVPFDTKDKDKILESELFDTREAFLTFCQENNYKYDSLRQARHSSMMVLGHYHYLAPKFVICSKCNVVIESGQGWQCKVCPDYAECSICHHSHQLHDASIPNNDAQNEEAREDILQQRDILDVLMHASQCPSLDCGVQNCNKVRGHIEHWEQCQEHAVGSCLRCESMQLHAKDCKEKKCRVPPCKEQNNILDVLVHASQCPSLDCGLQNCGKARGHIEHWKQCQERAVGGCLRCMIIQLHAKDCKESKCQVPPCKERVKRERGKAITAV